jgi:predicted phage terminase large subunit-like protein
VGDGADVETDVEPHVESHVELFQPVETTIALHHRLLLEKLDEVSRTPHGRMMVFMPPGSAKSTYASVVFPSRYLGEQPGRKLILASYGDELARKMGRRTRAIVRQPRYAAIFDCGLTTESRAAQEFALTNGSEYMACGILSGVTGNRAHCLLPSAIVETDSGFHSIEHLFECSFSGKVLSYEHNTKRVVYRSIKALARRKAGDFYRIITASGAVVEATGNHRFWTERGWVEAHLLTEGDRLLRALPQGTDAAGIYADQGGKERSQGDLLRACVPSKSRQSFSWLWRASMQSLRESGVAQVALVLLGRLQDASKRIAQRESTSELRHSDAAVRGLQQAIQANEHSQHGEILFPRVQGSWTCHADAGRVQSGMAQRSQSGQTAASFSSRVSESSSSNIVEGWDEVRGVLVDAGSARASHRYGCVEQSLAQSGDALRDLSSEVACRRAVETESDVVAVVERVCEPTKVYDIQVEGTECFFANGILVHNCIIIDDPIKGREQANSETIRNKTWDAYQDDLLTRLVPGGSVIIIQTRWHEDDLAGRILPTDWNGESGKILCKDGNVWEVLCLQARCEVDNDPLGRARGEYLWPEWFDRRHWAQFEENPRTWAALYQQRPAPLDGDLFKPDQIRVIDALPAENIQWVRGWDLAGTTDGDYTAGVRLGRLPDSRFVIADVVRLRVGPDQRDAALVNTAARDGPRTKQSIPQDPGQAGKTQVLYLTRALAGYTVISSPESGDKVTRAEPVAAQINVGNVSMLRGDWNAAFVNELRIFPNGTNDDQVDGLSRAFAELIGKHPMKIDPNILRHA